MTKRQHFERWLKSKPYRVSLDYTETDFGGFYRDDSVDMAWQAWQASPKTRPTEPSKITKDQLDAMKADTTNIVDHLRGIYAGAASRYPVTPLMMLAADEIERMRVCSDPVAFRMRHHLETEERDWSVMPIRFLERNKHPVYVIELLYTKKDNKKPAEAV